MRKLLVIFLLIQFKIVFPQSYSYKATNLISEYLADKTGTLILIIEPFNYLYDSQDKKNLQHIIPSNVLDSLFQLIPDTFTWSLPISNVERISLDSFEEIRTLPIIRIRYQITPKTEKRHQRKIKRVIERYSRRYSSINFFHISPPLFWENYCILRVVKYKGISFSYTCLLLFNKESPQSYDIIDCKY